VMWDKSVILMITMINLSLKYIFNVVDQARVVIQHSF